MFDSRQVSMDHKVIALYMPPFLAFLAARPSPFAFSFPFEDAVAGVSLLWPMSSSNALICACE
jgi:hypothetical protein